MQPFPSHECSLNKSCSRNDSVWIAGPSSSKISNKFFLVIAPPEAYYGDVLGDHAPFAVSFAKTSRVGLMRHSISVCMHRTLNSECVWSPCCRISVFFISNLTPSFLATKLACMMLLRESGVRVLQGIRRPFLVCVSFLLLLVKCCGRTILLRLEGCTSFFKLVKCLIDIQGSWVICSKFARFDEIVDYWREEVHSHQIVDFTKAVSKSISSTKRRQLK